MKRPDPMKRPLVWRRHSEPKLWLWTRSDAPRWLVWGTHGALAAGVAGLLVLDPGWLRVVAGSAFIAAIVVRFVFVTDWKAAAFHDR